MLQIKVTDHNKMLVLCSIFPAPIRFIKYIERPRNALGFIGVIFIASVNPRAFVGLLTYIILVLHSQLICIDYSFFQNLEISISHKHIQIPAYNINTDSF